MKSKAKFTWSEGEYNEQGDAMHSDQCRQGTGSKCICPPLKQEHSDVSVSEHTPTDTAMENLAILDLMTREGWSEGVVNRVERTLNSHEELVEALIAMQAQAGRTGPEAKAALDLAYKALAKSESR